MSLNIAISECKVEDELIVNDIISLFLIGRELLTTHIIQTLFSILSGMYSKTGLVVIDRWERLIGVEAVLLNNNLP